MTVAPLSRRLLSAVAGGATALVTLAMVPGAPIGAAAAAAIPETRQATTSPRAIWTPIKPALPETQAGMARTVHPGEYAAFRLDLPTITTRLDQAPPESRGASEPLVVAIPAPSGEMVRFEVRESPVLEAGLAAARPDISTFAGRSITGPPASIRLDTTPLGFHASVRGASGSWYIDPAYVGADQGADAPYLSYDARALPAPETPLIEPEAIPLDDGARTLKSGAQQRIGEGGGNAVVARTYRIAFATDPSYSTYFAPDATTPAEYNLLVTAAKATLMNRVNQIYGDDMSLRMLLVNDTDKTNFNTAADAYDAGGACGSTGCYVESSVTAGCSSALLTRTKNVLGQVIGAANYDVGHIGLGINGGGIASLGVVGLANKAQGCTGLPFPVGDFYAIDYVAHEIGHQFAGNHTFDGINGSCAATNRSADTSVEPGSGSSVMAYAGICAQDDLQPHTDPYFSQRSQTEIGAHVLSTKTSPNEIQSVSLVGFGGTESFTLTFPGLGTTATIANGTNYTTAGIKAAVEAVTGSTATVAAYFGSAAFNTDGFQVTYSGTNAAKNIVNPTLQVVSGEFSAVVNDIVQGGPATNGGVSSVTSANRVPTVTAPAAKTIPMLTPFELTGSATDLDGNELLYLWEQNDVGPGVFGPIGVGQGLTVNGRTTGPLFRVFGAYADVSLEDSITYLSPGQNLAGTTPTRTFPDIEQIIAGSTNADTGMCPVTEADDTLPNGPVLECYSEMLPGPTYVGSDLDRTMNFRLTARDLGGALAYDGGTSFGDTALTVSPIAGPFTVDSQATTTTVTGGGAGTISWSVAQTNTAALAPNVKISLSTDGGRTYPTTLLETTPNDGSQAITWPNIATSQARVKVSAVGNYFFDINDADFTITAVPGLTLSGTAVDGVFSAQYSDEVTPEPVLTASSATADGASISASATGLPAGLSLTRTTSSEPGVRPGTATFRVSGATTATPAPAAPVEITVSDGVAPAKKANLTIAVTKEDAAPTYTGPTQAVASQGGTDAVEVTLSADVVDAADGSLGDLGRATATFVDTITDETLCSAPVVPAAEPGSATTSCSFGADLTGTDDRTYQISISVGGDYVGATAQDSPLEVRYDSGLVVSVPAATASVEYSDALDPALELTLSDRFVESSALSVTATGLPTGLALTRTAASAGGVLPGTATYRVTGAVTDAIDAYPVTFTAGDGGAHPAQQRSTTITVKREKAGVTYTGPTAVSAASTDTSTPIEMTAAVAGESDGAPGDITAATVAFTDTATGETLCAAAPVTQTAPGAGTATCTVTADFPADDGRTYEVDLEVLGRYVGESAQDSSVSVEQAEPADTTPPETTITSAPRRGSLVLDRVFDVTYSSEPEATYTCSVGKRSGACPESGSVTVRSLPAGTYDFSVAATDAAGNTDETPATRRFSVPVNDRKLKIVRDGWDRSRDKTSYRGSYVEAQAKGSTLKYRITDAKSLALIFRQGPGFGAVDVFLGKTKLRTVRTRASTSEARQIGAITTFPATRTGLIRIVTRSGKTVQIEGLGVRSRPTT